MRYFHLPIKRQGATVISTIKNPDVQKQLTVVIVNYRSWTHLKASLSKLLSDSEHANQLEIVVVDNLSNDGLFEDFSKNYPQASFILNNGNHGFAHACNLGAAEASTETLLFLNPDVLAEPEQLLQLLEEKRRLANIAILAPLQVDARGRPQKVGDLFPGAIANLPLGKSVLNHWRSICRSLSSDDNKSITDWVTGSAIVMARDHFQQLGGFDDYYWMYSEDIDLCYRARGHGLRAGITANVVLTHCHGGASGRNESTRILTKTEVVISKHLFYCRNYSGTKAIAAHFTEAAKRTVPLAAASLLNLLSFGRIRALRIRTALFFGVLGHYRRWFKTGSPLSRQSVRYVG